MNHHLYLAVDIGCILIPLLFSFHPKIRFDKEWKFFIPACVIIGVFFLIWDEIFTEWGVWGFNSDYLLGIYIGKLPLEEILFFLCIPYACVFTYFVLKKHRFSLFPNFVVKPLFFLIFISVLGLLTLGYPKWYTTTTMVIVLPTLIVLYFTLFKDLKYIFSMYSLIVIPFLISNGILTGSGLEKPIVWYNDAENLGIRCFTIPIEDFFYGFLLLILNVFMYEKCKTIFT